MPKTYIVDISDLEKTWRGMEKRTRYEIRKCKKEPKITTDIERFNKLHKLTRPDRKIDYEYILKVYKGEIGNYKCVLYETDTAMAMIGYKGNTAYYLLACRDKTKKPDGSPSAIIWKAMKDAHSKGIKKFNLCGANKPNIKLFKRGFGGKLVEAPYCLNY